jgi:hypothetical protein
MADESLFFVALAFKFKGIADNANTNKEIDAKKLFIFTSQR